MSEPVINISASVVSEDLINTSLPPMLQNTDSLETEYPQVVQFAVDQSHIFWLPGEVKVEKDVQDIRVRMSDTARHGVISTLTLFTHYERKIGEEYWGGRFKNTFKRHEFQRMAATFAMFELAIHKPFYSKINETLNLDNDAFYNSYKADGVLVSRMDFIDKMVESPDELLSLAVFSIVEGAVLYSSFAFLKHFQAQGKNQILNIVRGINFSVRDESLHSKAGAWVFQELKMEMKLTDEQEERLHAAIIQAAIALYEHEAHIVDLIFSKGPIDGITALQLKNFVQSRINECLHQLGYKKLYEVKYNPIAEWFYANTNSFVFNDTFSGVGNSYHRNWDESSFVWKNYQSPEPANVTLQEPELVFTETVTSPILES